MEPPAEADVQAYARFRAKVCEVVDKAGVNASRKNEDCWLWHRWTKWSKAEWGDLRTASGSLIGYYRVNSRWCKQCFLREDVPFRMAPNEDAPPPATTEGVKMPDWLNRTTIVTMVVLGAAGVAAIYHGLVATGLTCMAVALILSTRVR